MALKVISKVCDCGKGYRSVHDLKCGHCRSANETAKLNRYHRLQEAQYATTQREYYGHSVPVCQPGDGTYVIEVPD